MLFDTLIPPLFWLVMKMMTLLAPAPDALYRYGELATAITTECLADAYAGGDAEVTASLDVAVAFRESSFKRDAVGDGGHSVGAFQIYDGDRAMLEDVTLAVRTAHRMIRQSARVDPRHPLAFYARGPRYASEEARRLSDDRVKLAAKTLAEARRTR
jgi:hypothetical protein